MAEVATLSIGVDASSAASAAGELKKLESQGKATESAVNDLSAAFRFLAGAMLVREAAEAIKNAVMLAARYETLGSTLTIMGNNVRATGAEMRQFQQELEDTGISAIKARGSLQIMAAAQINVAMAAKLGRVAQDAAVLANIDSSTAFQNLVRGIATGESRIIRHMGIMVNFGRDTERIAKSMGVLASELTQTQRAEIRLQLALDEGAKRAGVYEASMTTAGKQMLSMVRYTENLQVQLGSVFNPATNAVVFALADALKTASLNMKEWEKSGGQAEFAQLLKEKFQGIINVVSWLTTAVRDNATEFKNLIIALAALKFGPIAAQIWASVTATIASVAATRTSLAAKAQDAALTQVQAQREYNWAASKVASTQALIREAGGQAISNRLRLQSAAAIELETVRRVRLTAATEASTLATLNLAGAQTVLQRAVTALGGPIGVLLLALTAVYMIYQKVKDETVETAQVSTRSAKSREDEVVRQMARDKKFVDLVQKNSGDVKIALKKMFDPADMPEIRKLDEELLKLQNRLKELSSPSLWKSFVNTFGKGWISPVLATVKSYAWEAQSDAIIAEFDNRNQKASLIATNIAGKKLSDLAEAARIEESRKQAAMTAAEEKYKSHLSLNKEILDVEEKIAEQLNKGLAYSKRTTDNMKAQLDYEKTIAVLDATRTELQRTDKFDAKMSGLIDSKADRALELRNATIAANDFSAAQKVLHDSAVLEASDRKLATDMVLNLEQANVNLTGSLREQLVTRLMSLDMDEKERMSWLARYDAAKKLNELTAIKQENERYADQLNKNKRDGDTQYQIDRLNGANSTAKLIGDVYTKTWIDIMMKGDTATAYILQSTEKLFNSLGQVLGNFATGTKFSFKDLMASLARDLANFMAQKAMMQMFQLLVGTYLNYSSGGDLGNATGNSNGSIIGAGKAYGGPVAAGMGYPVGEKGPETFYPGVSGQIVPNQGQGGGLVVQNYITISPDKSSKSSSDNNSQGASIGDSLFAMMNEWAVRERRPNGLLDMRGTR